MRRLLKILLRILVILVVLVVLAFTGSWFYLKQHKKELIALYRKGSRKEPERGNFVYW